jgi:hypothetical protein
MNEYNDAKNSYVKQLEKNALEWFHQQATPAATNRVAALLLPGSRERILVVANIYSGS